MTHFAVKWEAPKPGVFGGGTTWVVDAETAERVAAQNLAEALARATADREPELRRLLEAAYYAGHAQALSGTDTRVEYQAPVYAQRVAKRVALAVSNQEDQNHE